MIKKKLVILLIPIIAVIVLFAFFTYGGDSEEIQLTGAATGLEETEILTKTSCDDGNTCTIDVFNELTNECEHTVTDSCCGNSKCEEGERCDETTHKTACPEDCSLACPAYLVMHKLGDETQTEDVFTCGNSVNCERVSENYFKISGIGETTLNAAITNIGERASKVITSKFYCDYETKSARYDGDTTNGIVFWDFFEDETQDTVRSLNAYQSGGNSINYILDIDMVDKIDPEAEVNCRLVVNSEDFLSTQEIKLKFIE